MVVNKLHLNPSKTEFLVMCAPRQSHKISVTELNVAGTSVSSVGCARNLGAWFDDSLNMVEHLHRVFKAALVYLHLIRSVRNSLYQLDTEKLVPLSPQGSNIVIFCSWTFLNCTSWNCSRCRTWQRVSFLVSGSMTTSHLYYVTCTGCLYMREFNIKLYYWLIRPFITWVHNVSETCCRCVEMNIPRHCDLLRASAFLFPEQEWFLMVIEPSQYQHQNHGTCYLFILKTPTHLIVLRRF